MGVIYQDNGKENGNYYLGLRVQQDVMLVLQPFNLATDHQALSPNTSKVS